MNVRSKIRTAAWFLRRPHLWSQAALVLGRKLRPDLDTPEHRARATEWCARRAVSTEAALRALGWTGPVRPFAEIVGEDAWSLAKRRADESPVRMGGAGNLELLFHAAELCSARRVVETGVAYGWSSFALLESLSRRPGSQLASTDMPYAQMDNEPWVGTVVPDRLRRHWTLFRQADRQALPKAIRALGGTFDLCHYDSDKSYHGRMWAYPILWAALRPGGLFVSDDVQDNEGFRHFTEKLGREPIVIEFAGKYIGVLRKEESNPT